MLVGVQWCDPDSGARHLLAAQDVALIYQPCQRWSCRGHATHRWWRHLAPVALAAHGRLRARYWWAGLSRR